MRRMFSIVILILGIVGSVTASVSAQTTQADITITTIPIDITPGGQVVLQTNSYGVNLDDALFSWSYNGKVVASGVGKRSITVIAPSAGATGLVTATVTGAGFAPTTASIVLRPASVDVLWEAVNATTPPFYKGKALLTDGNLVRATAIAAASAPKQLSYTWSRNTTALPAVSGYGKGSIIFRKNILANSETVAVQAQGGVFSGGGKATIVAQNPQVIAYKNDDGFVDYFNGFASTIPFPETGAVLHFEPYYFAIPRSITNDLSIELQSEDTTIEQNTTNPFELALSRPDTNGESPIRVILRTVAYSLQNIEKTFTILFN